MSFESEVTYLKANCPFAEGEALQLAFQGSITGAGFNGWEGLIAISQHKLFFSSEPGFVSNGGVVWAAFDSLASISRTGARVHVELYINGKTSIDVHVNGFATPDVKQNVEQMVEYARRCRCHTVQTPITDEFSAAMDVEDDERAILLLESVGTKDNLSVLPHSFIALFLTRVGRHDEAVRAVEEAKRRGLAQLSLVAWIHCCAHRAQGEVHEMEREASRVLSELGNAEGPFAVMEPEVLRGWALDALLDCQVHLEKWALALQTTAALESACPDHSGCYLTRVRIALVMEDVPLAEEALRAYRAHENHVPAEAKFSEAMIRWAKDDRDAAIELAHSVLDEYPQAMEVIHALLEWLGTAKRYEDVLCTARRALDAFEEPDPYVLTTQANAFLRLNRPAEALEAGDHALRLATGENFHALVFGGLVRADALAELGRGEDALGAVQSVREASTIIPDGLVQQQWRRRWEYCLALVEAKALCGLERYEQALPLLRIAARLPPEEGELHDEIDRLQQRAREKLDARADHAAPSEELRPVAGLSLFGKRNEAQRKLSVLHRRLAVDARLAELADEAKQLKDYYDRPLLLAILGEFNAGKSTFINALLGEDLLPTDVVPTTATINLLKYGDSPSAQLVWADGSVEEVALERLRQYVVEQRDARANDVIRRIKYVEVRQPHEVLKRNWIVDTPGLNAIVPEHVAVTREFVKQADAVVWLFRADQAGKKSEHDFLKFASGFAGKSLGVLNHLDRVPVAEVPELLEGAKEDFADVLSTVVGVSARKALESRVKSDPRQLQASGFPALEKVLVDDFFSKSRELKQQATFQKAAGLVAAVERLEAASNEIFAEQMGITAELRKSAASFDQQFVRTIDRLRRDVERTLFAACQAAASQLVKLIGEHGRGLPYADARFLGGAVQREIAPSFKYVADQLDDKAREQLAELRKHWAKLGEVASQAKAAALLSWFETDMEARLRENDILLEGVAEYFRGRLDAGDLWDFVASLPEDRAGNVTTGELSAQLQERYAFIVESTVEKSRRWATDITAVMKDLVERLEEELREQHDGDRQDVYRPVIRLREEFTEGPRENPPSVDSQYRPGMDV